MPKIFPIIKKAGAPVPVYPTVEGTINLLNVQENVDLETLEVDINNPNYQTDLDLGQIESDINMPNIQFTPSFFTMELDVTIPNFQVVSDLAEVEFISDLPSTQYDLDIGHIEPEVTMPDNQNALDMESIESDINIPNNQSVADLDTVELDTTIPNSQYDTDLGHVEPEVTLNENQSVPDLSDIEADVIMPNAQQESDLSEVEMSTDLPNTQADTDLSQVETAIDMPNSQADTDLSDIESSIDMPNNQAKYVDYEVVLGSSVSDAMFATKDSWTPTVALCPDDANKNGTNLQISTATTTMDTYIGFDLTSLPAGADITSATLILFRTAVPAVNWGFNIFKITNANEGWDETTIKCSTRPAADGAAIQNVTGISGLTTGNLSTALGASVLTRLEERIGVGNVTLLLQMATAASSATFQSKDSGGSPGNDSGPKLRLTFRVTV